MSSGGQQRPSAEAGPPSVFAAKGLTEGRIVEATLQLVDEAGIAAASMRAVASRLNVRAMSLYKYLPDRDALFDAVVERIVNELGDDPEVQSGPAAGWRSYLESLAHGVRRYARGHPHAFPLVATRPPTAPWVNPPLRSLRWIEAMLAGLRGVGLSEDQVLYAYRVFNSFLLGYLLLETGAMTVLDPKPGDGAFSTGSVDSDLDSDQGAGEPADAGDPVPGGLSPTRSPQLREAAAQADTTEELVEAVGGVDPEQYPTVYALRQGLAQDRWDAEFEDALRNMLDRIERFIADPGTPHSSRG